MEEMIFKKNMFMHWLGTLSPYFISLFDSSFENIYGAEDRLI